jgi:fructose-1,6-bisphosphate aldolase class II
MLFYLTSFINNNNIDIGSDNMVNSNELLMKATNEHYAIPQFNALNLEWVKYILQECEILRSPVILGISESAIKHMGGYNVVYGIVSSLIKDLQTTIPVVLHLDHGTSVESCIKAIDAGFTSVMLDASDKPLEENIELVKKVIDYAKYKDVSVEAEVGSIGGVEEGINANIKYANIEDCIKLANSTGISSIAPAFGTVHGFSIGDLNIDFDLMRKVKESLEIPIVLHGGTGVSDELILESIKNGISKINISTELKTVWNKAMREFIAANENVYDPRKIMSSGESSIKEVIRKKVELFGSNNRI